MCYSLVSKGGDEKTLVNYDELDEYSEAGDGEGKTPRQRNICDKCARVLPCCPCRYGLAVHNREVSQLGFSR